MKYKLDYLHMWSDWTTVETNEVEIEDYLYFRIQNRDSCGAGWWVDGYKKGSNYPVNLTGHGAYLSDVVRFYDVVKDKVRAIEVYHWHTTNSAIHKFFRYYTDFLAKKPEAIETPESA